MAYTQANQPMSVATPLGADALLLVRLTGTEALNELFRFELDMLAPPGTTVAFDQVLGQSVTAKVELADGSFRYVNGLVSRLAQGGQVSSAQGAAAFIQYRAEVVPRLWTSTKNVQSRIFQQMAVPDILTKVLTGLTISNQIQGTFDPRDYCAQYNESDFDFACRLMEEEGIYFFFTHADGSHTLVLANTPQSHPDVPGPTTIEYEPVSGGTRADNRIAAWEKAQEIRSGKVTLWDHCFELPDQNLQAAQTILATVQAGTVSHSLSAGNNGALEIYRYPGEYAQRYDGVAPGGGDQASNIQKIFDDNARTAGIRMQQEATPALTISGEGTCRHLVAGHKFTLSNHFDGDGAYVLTRVEHVADLGDTYTGGTQAAFSYGNTFRCVPSALPFRPARVTRRPRVEGAQTAVVVGPSGQEIFTDKYGRVKVQFPWDRLGTDDASSSCWIRVGTVWAGKQWGAIHIPRIGMEVIVHFLEGDPDRPIIVGAVYNADNMPPWTLPDNMTQSGLISRSTLQGDATHFNQIQFEDKKGSEFINVHAERDYVRVVENNDSLTVGSSDSNTCPDGSQTISIYKDRTESVETGNESVTIKKGNRTVTVSEGNDKHEVTKGTRDVIVEGDDTHHVKTGNLVVNVDTGNDTLTVKTGNRTVNVNTGNDAHNVKTGNLDVKVDMGNHTTALSMGNHSTKLSLGNHSIKADVGSSTIEALQGITLKCGPSSIEMTPAGVTIKGMMISVQGTAMSEVKGPMVMVSADAMLQAKGAITMIG